MLGALHKHPQVWECLLGTKHMDKRVLTCGFAFLGLILFNPNATDAIFSVA